MPRVPLQSIWRVFVKHYKLTDNQIAQFERYLQELKQWNEQINLTALTNDRDILELHFDDSLNVVNFVDFSKISSCCDVGSGGGFPGIPLKILYPHLKIYLIEVKRKRINFLEHLIDTLKLDDVIVFPIDWRTFLRKTEFAIDLFCARASLDPEELIRMFKPSCPYNQDTLLYWASRNWEPTKKVAPYVVDNWEYYVGGRTRRIIKLKNSKK